MRLQRSGGHTRSEVSAYGWFGREARLRFLPLAEFKRELDPADAEQTREHVRRGICADIGKARRLLGFEPRYSSLAACREAVDWLIRKGELEIPR